MFYEQNLQILPQRNLLALGRELFYFPSSLTAGYYGNEDSGVGSTPFKFRIENGLNTWQEISITAADAAQVIKVLRQGLMARQRHRSD